MREIKASIITRKIAEALWDINIRLPKDVEMALNLAADNESTELGKSVLNRLIENKNIAKEKNIPLCQDTGIAIVYLEIGQQVHIMNGEIKEIVNQGVALGYENLRKSVVKDPLHRLNTKDNTPAVIYTELVPGDKVRIRVMAKGGGAENKSQLKMFNPTADIQEIKKFIIEVVKNADASSCPPLIVGVGIGGTFDYCAYLSKKALFRPVGIHNEVDFYQKLEDELLTEINSLNIGPAGYGGKTTALAVNVEAYPCHIASLPVAVNLQCHASRHKEIVI